MSIWFLTFSVLCQFSPCCYLLNGKKIWCVKHNKKKLFFILHQLRTVLPCQFFFFFKTQILCSEIKFREISKIPNSLSLSLMRLHSLSSPSPSLSPAPLLLVPPLEFQFDCFSLHYGFQHSLLGFLAWTQSTQIRLNCTYLITTTISNYRSTTQWTILVWY